MENEWLDLAWINFEKAIMHGQIIHDTREITIEQVLTDQQREKVYDLNARHDRETRKLLRSFVEAFGE